MIVFGPIMILFVLGILFILLDIYYTQPEEPVHIVKKQQPVNWDAEYENNTSYLNDNWDEEN